MVDTFITSLNDNFLVSVVRILLQIRDEVIDITSELTLLDFLLSSAFLEVDLFTGLVHRESVIAL